MKTGIAFVLLIFLFQNLPAQSDRERVLKVLDDQAACWNRGDIDCFMEGYWKSDSLMGTSKYYVLARIDLI